MTAGEKPPFTHLLHKKLTFFLAQTNKHTIFAPAKWATAWQTKVGSVAQLDRATPF